jgi:hypothetical protein
MFAGILIFHFPQTVTVSVIPKTGELFPYNHEEFLQQVFFD